MRSRHRLLLSNASLQHMTQPPAKKLLPNWAVAGLLGGFVVGTYLYSIRAVGDDSAEARFTSVDAYKYNQKIRMVQP